MTDTMRSSNVNGELSLVWEPITIRGVTIRNRIFQAAHSSQHGDAEKHTFSDRQVAYFRERARGEVGLSITETVASARSALGSFFHIVNVWDEKTIPSMAKMAEGVHSEGGEIFIQLAGMGIHDRERMFIDHTRPIWGVGPIPSLVHNEQPLIMGQREIRELVGDFGQSAANVQAAGINGAEFNSAHSYLHGQWLSPTYNKRTDAYGGSPEKRCRFALETAQSVRERTGDNFVLGIRFSWEEFMGPGGGSTAEDSEIQLEVLAASGLFDFFNISTGGYHTIHKAIPGMEGNEADGWLVPYSKKAKEIVGDRALVFVVNKIRDLHLAEKILADGSADMVGMARQLLADPFTVKKTREDREHEIIKCNGNNECAGRLWEHRELVCALNPVSGRESYWGEGSLKIVPKGGAKRVVVVGAGPAGMKVAAVAARRGHDVTLLEAKDEVGGHMQLLSKFPGLNDWDIAIDNLEREIQNTGVKVQLNTTATLKVLEEMAPDVVVVAAGAHYQKSGLSMYRPERTGIPGAELDFVYDMHTAATRAAEDPNSLGSNVLIVDETGGHLPVALAELLVDAGVSVVILSPRMYVGEKTYRNLGMSYMFPRIKTKGVRTTPQYFVEDITPDGGVRVYNVWTGPAITELREGVDSVVLSILRSSNEDLFYEASEVFSNVQRVGDVAAPRDVTAAIHDGEKVGRDI